MGTFVTMSQDFNTLTRARHNAISARVIKLNYREVSTHTAVTLSESFNHQRILKILLLSHEL